LKKSFSAADFFIDLIAPNVCPFCGEFIVWNSFACENCIKEAKPAEKREPPEFIETVYSAFSYEGKTEKAIYSLKYKHNPALAGLAAEIIVSFDSFLTDDYDLLVPVPMHRAKLYSRYYNPADIFAKRIRRLTGIPISGFALSHAKTAKEQHHLTERERFENAEKVYSLERADEIKGKRILLCDDVITTGATIGVCAKRLMNGGALSVSAASCASTHNEKSQNEIIQN
jgi:competence protein ComFC